MNNKIKVKIISIDGECPNNFKIGDKVIIDEKGVHGEICIHTLYSLLPKAFAMLYGATFPWLKVKMLQRIHVQITKTLFYLN